ncbi:hypothetical protein [Pseudomonas mandelii]|uniref:hypothetical protein n=1 Tax=Pseudomonas mandelii TaxID=75612 RepID=UPI003C7933C9
MAKKIPFWPNLKKIDIFSFDVLVSVLRKVFKISLLVTFMSFSIANVFRWLDCQIAEASKLKGTTGEQEYINCLVKLHQLPR